MNGGTGERLKRADVLRARALLIIGGVVGAHRLYLKQVPEAFIFFSTAGVFLLGILYDSFYIHDTVVKYNEKLDEIEDSGSKKFKGGRLLPTLSRMTNFSLSRFVCSVLYAMWLGGLCWIAGSVTFGRSHTDSIPMVVAMAAAATAGLFIVGNSGPQQRDLLYMWLGTFSTMFVMIKLLEAGALRALLFSAIAGTLLGNRTARQKNPKEKGFNNRHFYFWCSLFALLMCVIAVGASRHILERRVTARAGDREVTSSVGRIIYDRWTKSYEVYKFFAKNPQISYENTYRRRAPQENKSWFAWMDVDGWAGGRAPQWADHAAVFLVDLLRAETRALKGQLVEEPLKWAAWRTYVLVVFDLPATATDTDIAKACGRWARDNRSNNERAGEKQTDYRQKSTERACEVSQL